MCSTLIKHGFLTNQNARGVCIKKFPCAEFILVTYQILVIILQVGNTRGAFPRSLRIQVILFRFFVFVFRTNDLNLQVIANVNESEGLTNTKATQNYFVG